MADARDGPSKPSFCELRKSEEWLLVINSAGMLGCWKFLPTCRPVRTLVAINDEGAFHWRRASWIATWRTYRYYSDCRQSVLRGSRGRTSPGVVRQSCLTAFRLELVTRWALDHAVGPASRICWRIPPQVETLPTRFSISVQASGPDQSKPMCLLERPVRSHLNPKASALSAVAFP